MDDVSGGESTLLGRRDLPRILLPHVLIPLLSVAHVILRTPSSLAVACMMMKKPSPDWCVKGDTLYLLASDHVLHQIKAMASFLLLLCLVFDTTVTFHPDFVSSSSFDT